MSTVLSNMLSILLFLSSAVLSVCRQSYCLFHQFYLVCRPFYSLFHQIYLECHQSYCLCHQFYSSMSSILLFMSSVLSSMSSVLLFMSSVLLHMSSYSLCRQLYTAYVISFIQLKSSITTSALLYMCHHFHCLDLSIVLYPMYVFSFTGYVCL